MGLAWPSRSSVIAGIKLYDSNIDLIWNLEVSAGLI